MISLTRLSGSVFALNADLIERIDSTPDTVITLVDGKKYVVAEPLREVMSAILRHRAEVVALSSHIQVDDLRVVPLRRPPGRGDDAVGDEQRVGVAVAGPDRAAGEQRRAHLTTAVCRCPAP